MRTPAELVDILRKLQLEHEALPQYAKDNNLPMTPSAVKATAELASVMKDAADYVYFTSGMMQKDLDDLEKLEKEYGGTSSSNS